jgi:hypothetical protein
MFNCDNGTYDAWYWAHPPVYMPLNTNLEEAAHIKNTPTHRSSAQGACRLKKQLTLFTMGG